MTNILKYPYITTYGLLFFCLGDSPYVSNNLLAQKRVACTILDIIGKAIMDAVHRNQHWFSQLNWMYINDLVNKRKATLVIKSFNNLAPKYMSFKFKYASNHENNTWCNIKLLDVPSGKYKYIFENRFRKCCKNMEQFK